jgi:integrase/recombinase XerD
LGAAEPRYVLQSPGLVENCVGLYVPLLEFNLLPPLASETLHGHNRQQGPQVFTGLDLSTDRQQARRKLDLRRPKRERKLPQLLAEVDLKRFFRVIQDCGDVEHEIMLKFLFFTAVRVSELVKIKVGEVDLGSCKVFIGQGKGAKDRYILFPASFRLILKSHLQANPKNRYLFETSRCGPFTPRRIQQIVQSYRAQAGLTQPVHPHLFRHQMITYLTSRGLSDAQIQLISGHESKKSLEIYQHLSLGAVEQAYQEAVQGVSI